MCIFWGLYYLIDILTCLGLVLYGIRNLMNLGDADYGGKFGKTWRLLILIFILAPLMLLDVAECIFIIFRGFRLMRK